MASVCGLTIEGALFHDLRTAVGDLERAGAPRSVAMKLIGRKTESVHRRYAIVSESDLSEAVDRLERGSQPAPLPTPALEPRQGEHAKVN